MMKKSFVLASVLLTVFVIRAVDIRGWVDRAVRDAVGDAQAELSTVPIPAGKTVAVLPLNGDTEDGQARALVKSALTAAGKTCVEGKEDALVDEIVKEIAWDARKEDILDAATVERFGRLKSAQYLVYGGVRRGVTDGKRYVLIELELHVTEIATKKHVWGNVFARRLYFPTQDPEGLIDIPVEIRNTMRGKFRSALADSMMKGAKLSGVRNVACLPIVADVDQYVSGLVRDVLSASAKLNTVNLDITTRAEARFALKESPGKGDAVLYGVLRDCKAEFKSKNYLKLAKTYVARMEIQLWIEKGATREILWSDTLFVTEDFDQPMSWGELVSVLIWPWGSLIALIIIVKHATRVR